MPIVVVTISISAPFFARYLLRLLNAVIGPPIGWLGSMLGEWKLF